MPIYEYEYIGGTNAGKRFDLLQSMREPALEQHPETGEPIRRVIGAPMIGGKHSTASDKRKMTDSNLSRLGFTKYVKGDGGYEKAFGGGPESLTP